MPRLQRLGRDKIAGALNAPLWVVMIACLPGDGTCPDEEMAGGGGGGGEEAGYGQFRKVMNPF